MEFDLPKDQSSIIKVIGVGGGASCGHFILGASELQ